MTYVTRFAPSPNGRLHLGHAFSALRAYEAAREAGGRFLLRIEDIDTGRARPEFEAAIYEDLEWLGLEWEQPVRRQSEHFDEYARVLAGLADRELLYPCFCTRKEIRAVLDAPHGPAGDIYPGTCSTLAKSQADRRTASGEAFVMRLNLSAALSDYAVDTDSAAKLGKELGDVALARKDVPTGYHLACVHDDAVQGVTDVIRGRDLLFAEPLHRLIQGLLGYPSPNYHHHRLILGPDGKRLAKRDHAATLCALRESGVTAEQVRTRLAQTPTS